jgi:hypothetical protein
MAMAEREAWRRPRHQPGDCIAEVPEAVKDQYEREGPRLEREGELPPVTDPDADDFENPRAFEAFRSDRAAP